MSLSAPDLLVGNATPPSDSGYLYDVVVVGGFGHVGLPLAVSLAGHGKRVCALDINAKVNEQILAGIVPFDEEGCVAMLRRALDEKTFSTSLDPSVVGNAAVVIVVIGTPVDQHLNPEFSQIWALMESLLPYLKEGQLLVLRSTVYPGTSDRLRRYFEEKGKRIELAFCPERIAEGRAMEELESLPQIVASYSEDGIRRCNELFSVLTQDIIELTPLEAELAKLYSNTWRYIMFAAANQFYMLANDHGADFSRIHHAVTHNYPRAKGLPRPGFTAGPCLFKDAMQLAAFNNNQFYMGHAAMLVNEGLPNYLVDRLKRRFDLTEKSVGVLGMAFKGNSDDKRGSLSYKLRKLLAFESREVLSSDVYIQDPGFVSAEELIAKADIIFVGAPHREYQNIEIPEGKVVVDIWNMWGNGCVV